jgi:hypothetical protein
MTDSIPDHISPNGVVVNKVGRPVSVPVFHPKTGYLEPSFTWKSNGFDSDKKVKFLELYLQSGNISESMRLVGCSFNAFASHLRKDKKFAEDFNLVKLQQKHRLEEVMMQHGLKEKGFMDRIAWLRKNYPSEYGQKTTIEHRSNTKVIDSLYDNLNILEAEIVEDKPSQDGVSQIEHSS